MLRTAFILPAAEREPGYHHGSIADLKHQFPGKSAMREYAIGTTVGLEASLTPACIAEIETSGSEKLYLAGDRLFLQGEPAQSIYLLQSGRVKSVLADRAGNESLLRIHLPDSVLGLTALGSGKVRDASAIAIDPVRVVEIDSAKFEQMIRQGGDLAAGLVQLLIDRMCDFHHRVGEFYTLPVEYRLALALLAISRPDPSRHAEPVSLDIPLTHEELAQLIGSRRPTVSTILARFRQAGLIARNGRATRIDDRGGLERRVAEFEM
jgi:CRP-like cAMP-binding protein